MRAMATHEPDSGLLHAQHLVITSLSYADFQHLSHCTVSSRCPNSLMSNFAYLSLLFLPHKCFECHCFVVNCPNFKDQFESLWSALNAKIISSNSIDGGAIAEFIGNLKHQERLQFLLGGLVQPFNQLTKTQDY